LQYLFYGLDDKPLLNASYTLMIDVRPSMFKSISIAWTPENDNKKVVFVIGREASLHISPPQHVVVVRPVEVYRGKKAFTLYSGTVTASGNSDDIDVSIYSAMELQLKVTEVGGVSPALSVYIEGKFDTTGDYKTLVFQENITTTGIWYFTITQLIFKTIRVRWVVTGESPLFTFRVDGVGLM
jgi:hypothetical protein